MKILIQGLSFLLLIVQIFSQTSLLDRPNGSGQRVLFVQEKGLDVNADYSQFLRVLRDDHKFQVSVVDHDNREIQLEDPQQGYLYDHIILFLPQLKSFKGTKLTSKALMRFVDQGHNLVLATGSNCSELIAALANEVELPFDAASNVALDHFQNAGASDLLLVDVGSLGAPIFPEKVSLPVYFQGMAHAIRKDSDLHIPLLLGSETSYSSKLGTPAANPYVSGKQTGLVSALVARNNARVLVSGSILMFSDEFFSKEKSGNRDFVKHTVSWTFQQRGTLRSRDMTHRKVNEDDLGHYIVNDDINFSIVIEEWNAEQDKWIPFVSSEVQLEFIMLDPYLRLPLNSSKGNYTVQFKAPDVYGIFTFKVILRTIGYGGLGVPATTAPVYPLRHNQYERFLSSAFPYYASEFSMLAGLFIFSFFFLFHKN